MTREEHLATRKARCTYCAKTRPSSEGPWLAFFEYQGPGSEYGQKTCKHCRYYAIAHERKKDPKQSASKNKSICDNFEPIETTEVDKFYCGCRGWD